MKNEGEEVKENKKVEVRERDAQFNTRQFLPVIFVDGTFSH